MTTSSYYGIDTYSFPGLATMDWLRANTSACWTGLYLTHAPDMPDRSWIDAYMQIKDTWGIAPIYLGRQAPGKGKPDQRTPANAIKDANDAAWFAKEAGIPAGRVIYLDIEQGGIQSPASVDYFNAWVNRLQTYGFAPGVYCSYLALDQLLKERPQVVPWVYKLTVKSGIVVGPHFENDAGAPAAPYQNARMQQFAQNCQVKTGVENGSLLIDVSVSTVSDPSEPNNSL